MPWKLHEILNKDVYKNVRYERIRFLEQVGGEPALTPYPDPGDHHADIGVAFRTESNWDEILEAFGFDLTTTASEAEKDYITRIKALINGKTFTAVTIEQLKTKLREGSNLLLTHISACEPAEANLPHCRGNTVILEPPIIVFA